MEDDKVAQSIEYLSQKFHKESEGSIDHFVNAKAISFGDYKLRDHLAKFFNNGYSLARITPIAGYGSRADNFVFSFELHRKSEIAHADLDSIILRITVNLPAKSVARIDEVRESSGDLNYTPFVVEIPSRAGDAITKDELLLEIHERERSFLRGLGLTDLVRARDGDDWIKSQNNTFVDTSTGTTTSTTYESAINSGYTPDTITDTRQDPGGDTDTKIDGSSDPTRDGLLALPTDRPVLVLPRPKPGTGPRPLPPGPDPIG